MIRRFWADERADGTTSSAVRIGIWVAAALGVVAVIGRLVIYPLVNKATTCATTAAGLGTTAFTASGTAASC